VLVAAVVLEVIEIQLSVKILVVALQLKIQ
jgi:hypothetical protein